VLVDSDVADVDAPRDFCVVALGWWVGWWLESGLCRLQFAGKGYDALLSQRLV
jgi:hypothetical protein